MAGENFISAEALEAFKQSGLYDPAGAGALTQMMNAMNAGKVDSKGMTVTPEANTGATEEEGGNDFKKVIQKDPVTGLPTGVAATREVGDDHNQTFTVDEINDAKVTSSLSGQNIKPNDLAASANQGSNISTTDNSQAVDLKGQQAVNDSKEEMEKLPKPPQTLFGMASKTLDKSGFTEGADKFGDMAGGWGMEGLGKMGMDAGVGGNLAGAGQAAAGFGGKMLGMAGSALSPIMAGMGTAMHGIGRGMMGIQMPRY